MAVIIFGDSITNKASDYEGGGWTSRLFTKIASEFRTVYAPGVVTSNHSVLELGIGGDTILGIESRYRNELSVRADVAEGGDLDEIHVGVAVGVNDSRVLIETGQPTVALEEYEAAYRRVLTGLHDIGVHVFVVGLTPVDENKMDPCLWIDPPTSYVNRSIMRFNEVAQNIAQEYGTIFIDVYTACENEVATHGYDALFDDGLHPNAYGHELIADLVFSGIKSKLG